MRKLTRRLDDVRRGLRGAFEDGGAQARGGRGLAYVLHELSHWIDLSPPREPVPATVVAVDADVTVMLDVFRYSSRSPVAAEERLYVAEVRSLALLLAALPDYRTTAVAEIIADAIGESFPGRPALADAASWSTRPSIVRKGRRLRRLLSLPRRAGGARDSTPPAKNWPGPAYDTAGDPPCRP
jgi:hypothetical protein